MLHKLINLKDMNKNKGDKLLAFQLAEANEIADMIISRIEDKVNTLKELEIAVDKKIAILEKLLQRVESLKMPSFIRDDRYDEIMYLKTKGFSIEEISKLLNIPIGEAELILNLKSNKSRANLSK
jgi:hypothetical protein